MKLIADCGGTKVEWCLIDQENVPCRFKTPGMNAMMLTYEEMTDRIAAEVAPQLKKWIPEITDIYFYGAGCVSKEVCDKVRDAIKESIPCDHIEVATDLLGAARALNGHEEGIACILGTGSNSCYYNGENIVENISPLGFILGDEGSGACLGKILVGDVLKRQLPPHICEKFLKQFDTDAVKIVQHVYREPYPNKYLASFTPFLKENITEPEIHSLVFNAFKSFFKRNVMMYHKFCKVNVSGSVGYHFADQFRQAAYYYGFRVDKIIDNPIEDLIKYHQD